MDVHEASSVLDEMSFALSNEEQMVDNVMTVSPIEVTNATGTYLQHLNEDCLLEIFSRNSLTLEDLCSLAETCKRFKQITQRLFSMGFAIEPHPYSGCMYTYSSKHHSELDCTFQDIERILKNFGPHLSELHMLEDLALVNLITKYCDDITLKCLEIRGLKSTEGVTQQLSSIFQRLLKLYISSCDLPTEPWYMNCDSLIELKISYCKNGAALLRNTFPILEQFRFHSIYEESFEDFSEFLTRHGCLKSIEICGAAFSDCELLHAISCSCNELVDLTLHYVESGPVDISHLQSLTKLEILDIGYLSGPTEHTTHCKEIDFSRAFKSLKTMKMSLDGGPQEVLNQIFDVLSRLQGLRELKLVDCADPNNIPWTRLTQLRKVYLTDDLEEHSYLLDVIRQLINLEELELEYLCRLKREEFSKIVKIVERRAHVLTLRCDYDFIYEDNCNETRKVKLIKL